MPNKVFLSRLINKLSQAVLEKLVGITAFLSGFANHLVKQVDT